MFVSPRVFESFAVVLVLCVPLLSLVFAQDDDKKSDDNTTDSSLMTNYNALREEGQGFFVREGSSLYEKPGSVSASVVGLYWWCDLEFSSEDAATTNNYGYVGRAVVYFLGSSLEDILADGAQISNENRWPVSVSAVMVPTLGIFEGQFHATNDDWVIRYWDDGSATLPNLGWEGHDEGDTHPNSETSALSLFGMLTKITTEAAAELLGMEVADMTPATCSTEYAAAWNATHVPVPIDTSVTELEDTVAQLQADNKELLSRIVAIEGSLPAKGSGSSGEDEAAPATSASSLFMMAAFEHATTDIVMKSIMTVTIILGLVAVDFL